MSLELLTMTLFWTWNTFHPALQPEPVAVPSKVILQASWVEPVSLRDETTPAATPNPAKIAILAKTSKWHSTASIKNPQKPLWQAAQSWEIPPILWAGFEAFLAAGLGILSTIKK